MGRWSVVRNIANEIWITDKYNERDYTMDDIHLIVSELNNYEKKIERMESYINHLLYPRVPHHYCHDRERLFNKLINPDMWTIEMIIFELEKKGIKEDTCEYNKSISWLKELLFENFGEEE